MLKASRLVESQVDAIDINLGCPQRVAYSGNFGSYLLDREKQPLVFRIVSHLSQNLKIPVFCKIRLLPSVKETIEFCQQLKSNGCRLIAIHARYRGTATRRRDGPAHLDQVLAIKKAIKGIPILSNGNVRTSEDVDNNHLYTQADGIMCAEGLLDDPALFHRGKTNEAEKVREKSKQSKPKADQLSNPSALALAKEYLECVERFPSADINHVVFHIRRICKKELAKYQLIEELRASKTTTAVNDIVRLMERYDEGKEGFQFDSEKAKRQEEARKKRAFEEKCRKKYVARMERKAKRLGVAVDTLLKPTSVPGGHVYGADPSWLAEKGK